MSIDYARAIVWQAYHEAVLEARAFEPIWL